MNKKFAVSKVSREREEGDMSFTKKKKKNCKKCFLFLINCWSSVVASVVLPQLCNLHFFFFDLVFRRTTDAFSMNRQKQ